MIVLRCSIPTEFIHKIVISVLIVPLDEMNYGNEMKVRHIKSFKIQNQQFAGFLQDRFFLKKIAKFTEIQLCWNFS